MNMCFDRRSKLRSPLVSVIIPAYNSERWIRNTLCSVQRQTIENIEIIVVDDGSSDTTRTIASDVAESDDRIVIISQNNQGVGAARNSGISVARGCYIAPIDSDDLWHPMKLQKQLEAMHRAGPKTGLVYCLSKPVGESGESLGPAPIWSPTGNVLHAILHGNFIGNGSSPLIRKSVLQVAGSYLTREQQGGAEGCEDWDLYIRIAEKSGFEVVREELTFYRQSGSCMSNSVESMIRSFRNVLSRARVRNSEFGSEIFRSAEANFCAYLGSRCLRSGDYNVCIGLVVRFSADNVLVCLDRRLRSLLVRSLICVVKSKTIGII